MSNRTKDRALKLQQNRETLAEKREYLHMHEFEALLKACSNNRDKCLLLVGFYHGLRINEALGLTWECVDFDNKLMVVGRLKNGIPCLHPLIYREHLLLKKWRKEQYTKFGYHPNFVFTSMRKQLLDDSTVRRLCKKLAETARLGIRFHYHMLRHTTGHYMVEQGIDSRVIQAYLGHKSINSTARYTSVSSHRYEGIMGKS